MDPVIEFAEQLLSAAISQRATDIHIEPRGEGCHIRLRIQGELKVYPHAYQDGSSLIQRFKVMAQSINISEKRLPQDGSYTYKDSSDNVYDLRISTLPTIDGEKLTLRILYRDTIFSNIKQLGMKEADYNEVIEWIQETKGLYLITGPTGSGKTTTLYAIIQYLNKTNVNICTIEDPVEIRLEGIHQLQVNEAAGLTFGYGLRSLLRHDPDVIMIGEIRDIETADMAIRASLTGHLVFATLHANDAASAITRLLEMGIEPYLVTSVLKGIISQQMITHYCPECNGNKHCYLCDGKGIFRRAPIFDLLKINEEMSPYILNKRPPSEIRAAAKAYPRQLSIPI